MSELIPTWKDLTERAQRQTVDLLEAANGVDIVSRHVNDAVRVVFKKVGEASADDVRGERAKKALRKMDGSSGHHRAIVDELTKDALQKLHTQLGAATFADVKRAVDDSAFLDSIEAQPLGNGVSHRVQKEVLLHTAEHVAGVLLEEVAAAHPRMTPEEDAELFEEIIRRLIGEA